MQEQSPDAVRNDVGKKNVDIGIIVPAGFDAALQNGATPNLTVLLPETSNFGGDYVSAAIEAASIAWPAVSSWRRSMYRASQPVR